MFIEPVPIRSRQRPSSGFFSSQRPIISPRDYRKQLKPRAQVARDSPAHDDQDQPSQWNDSQDTATTTVRIVTDSPPETTVETSDVDENMSAAKANARGATVLLPKASSKPASAAKPDLQGLSVSSSTTPTNEAQAGGQHDTHSLLYTDKTHVYPPTQAEWHRRDASTASTLQPGDDGEYLHQPADRSETRLSQGTTLRGTPTPTEQDFLQSIEAAGRPSIATLQTLPEASPERPTLRAVAASSRDSGSVDDTSSDGGSSPVVRVFSSPSSDASTRSPTQARRHSWQSSSPTVLRNSIRSIDQHILHEQPSSETIGASSPNYVAYSPDSSRPRSSSSPLHQAYSIESIQSRLARPETGRSIATSSSWASGISNDTLPPLQVPKKRLRHKTGLGSLNAAAHPSYSSGSNMDEDIDTLPYPREHFSTHLSTIASESERSNSRQLSHFSLGSGVLTGDDSSSIPLSGTWPRRRRESAPISSVASEAMFGRGSEDEPGDMTLGVFREESAKPQPLALGNRGGMPSDRKYDGPLPPLPPIPRSRDSEEDIDRVSELQGPSLREKRSGYSLRRRSNSTPSGSHSRHLSQISRSETDRSSHASSLFPVWAKNYYGHGAPLMSASKVSLSLPPAGNGHTRNASQWTERSITSRLGTGYSEIGSSSPTSSRFLPSIFRPRTRNKLNGDSTNKLRRSKCGRPSADDNRPDSLQIFTDPLPQDEDGEKLPSGQPKYGKLKDSSEQQGRPLPRKYSTSKHWDEMQFPRPMTKDRLSDFKLQVEEPHLAPNKRYSRRFSIWRPPSFVESLDTLVRSRGNRQILLFALGFLCPLLWMLGAVLPIPKKPVNPAELKSIGGSEDDIQAAMMKHEAGDAERRWREEKAWQKARWWRWLNRVMSVVGVLVIGAVIALAIVATRQQF